MQHHHAPHSQKGIVHLIAEIQSLLDDYTRWLKDKTVLRQVDGWVEITTPYLDRHNDYLQLYIQRRNGGFILTDDGYILADLERAGCALDTPKRQELLRMTLNGFGVRLEDKRLEVMTTSETFPLKKHNLVQAMLAVNDLFAVASPVVTSLFFEDVIAWLDANDIRYTPKVKFTGRSGYDHLFDFVIPKSRQAPERILKAITQPNPDSAKAFAFSWLDTRHVRPEDAQAIALLNDTERAPSASVTEALHSYDIEAVLWSQRDKVRMRLAA